MMRSAYEILATEVGAPNPSDNAFLREALICAEAGLIWQSDRGGIDALDPHTGEEVEIKSTKLVEGSAIKFTTSRALSPTVIERFLNAGYWLFGVFDNFSNMAIVYRVEAAGMVPTIAALTEKMERGARAGRPLVNNPKTTLNSIRPVASVHFQSPDFEEHQAGRRRWHIRARRATNQTAQGRLDLD